MKSDIFKKLGDRSKIIASSFPKYIPPLFSVVALQKALTIISRDMLNELLFKLGKSLGKLIASEFKRSKTNINKIELIKFSLNEMSYMGFGKSEAFVFKPEKKQVVIKNLNNPWAKQYKRSFERQNKVMDFFISGVYSGIFSLALNKDCFFEEKLCISNGDNLCSFYLTFDDIFPLNYFNQKIIDSRLSEKNLVTNEIVVNPNELIQKMFSLNHITSNNGELKVWTIYCIMLPFDLYQIVFDFWNETSGISNILLYLGMIQSKIGVQFQVNKFGIKKGDDTFNSILNQLELLGLGKGKLIKHDKNGLEIEYKNYIPLSQYKKMFSSKNFNPYYTAGLLLGMTKFSYDKEIESYSILIDKGLKVKINLSKNKSDSFFNKIKENIRNGEIKAIIEEKMKHQYYLT